LTEISLGSVEDNYCPGDEVVFRIDVLNTGASKDAEVELTVRNNTDIVLKKLFRESFDKDDLKTLEHSWTVSENAFGVYNVEASLIIGDSVSDTKVRQNAFKVDRSVCEPGVLEAEEGSFEWFMLIIVLLFVFGALGAALVYIILTRSGSVEFTKVVDDEDVELFIKNNTRKPLQNLVLTDTIPVGEELKVKTLNAIRRHDSIVWDVGELAPGDSASLEYTIRDGRALNIAKAEWIGGEKELI
jgi:hypothetical protein